VYYWVHDCLWFCLVAIVSLSIERTYTARLKSYNKQYHDQTILVFDQYKCIDIYWHISLFTLVSGFFVFQFCQVGGLVIIHRRNEPNLTRCHQQSEFFRIPLCSINLHELSVQIRQLLTFFPQNIKAFAKNFPKKPFVYFTPNSFWSLSCENLLEKTSLIGVRIWLKHFVDTIQGSRYCTYLLVDIWKPYPKSKWVSF